MHTLDLDQALEENKELNDEFIIFKICIPTTVACALKQLSQNKRYDTDGCIGQAVIHYLEAWGIEGNWAEYISQEDTPPAWAQAQQSQPPS
ncbi:MAG: hypothetical protein AAGL08_13815, partial [Cyanobacteria bacterium J06573_11]